MSALLARHNLEDIAPPRLRLLQLAAVRGWVAIGCSLILFSSCSGPGNTSTVAKIVSLEETSAADRANVTTPNRPAMDQFLALGETWQVPAGKTATIAFAPGIMAALFNSSEIVIHKLRLAKDGHETGFDLMEREVEIQLLRGSLFGLVSSDGLKSDFRIRTELGILAAKPGSLFCMGKSEALLHVACIRGDIELVAKTGARQAVPPGKWCDWRKGEAAPTELQPSAASAQAQQETAEALEVEAAMQAWLLAEQKSVPRWRHP